MIKSSFRLLVGLALLVTFALSVAAQDGTVPRYEPLDDCFIEMPEEGNDYDCGYVTVPEFYDGRTDNTFSLGVIRVLSTSDEPAEPIFFGAGGPGGSVLQHAPEAAQDPDFYGQLLANHDLVFFAQRGTLHAEPQLACNAITDAGNSFVIEGGRWNDEISERYITALKSCYDDYVASGLDLSAFNSIASANDVNSIRDVFGYDMMIYYGESYGTMLGQHVMREFPEMLTAVILDGAKTLTYPSWETDIAAGYDYALGYIVDLCAADMACNEAFPNFEEDINTVYRQLRDTPMELSLEGGDITFTADGAMFATAIYNAMYQWPLVERLPYAVTSLANNEPDDVVVSLLGSVIPSAGSADSMHYAVVCSEDPINTIEEGLSSEPLRFEMIPAYIEWDASPYIAMCDYMDLPVLPDETDDAIVSDLPVLILNGGFDPITPEIFSRQIADTLPNSFSATVAYGDHVVATQDACAQSIMLQFVADPTTEPDSSCGNDPGNFSWFLPQDVEN